MRDMDRREREALDRHITGNYGEDQFRDDDDERLVGEGQFIDEQLMQKADALITYYAAEPQAKQAMEEAFAQLGRDIGIRSVAVEETEHKMLITITEPNGACRILRLDKVAYAAKRGCWEEL